MKAIALAAAAMIALIPALADAKGRHGRSRSHHAHASHHTHASHHAKASHHHAGRTHAARPLPIRPRVNLNLNKSLDAKPEPRATATGATTARARPPAPRGSACPTMGTPAFTFIQATCAKTPADPSCRCVPAR